MKILVIRFLAIGDAVISSVLCNSLKKSFPDSQVDYLVHEPSASLFRHHPYIDNVLELTIPERKNLIVYFRKVYQITRKNYDIVIDATSTEKSGMLSLFSRQAKYKIGRYKPKKGYFFTHKIRYSSPSLNKIRQRLDMLKPLAVDNFNIKLDDQMVIHITEQEKQAMKSKMHEHGISFSKPIFIFSVSSKIAFKKWCREKMIEVIKHCINKLNGQIVFYYWGKEEQDDITMMHENGLNNHPDVFSNIRISCSRDLAAIMTNCDMFVGNEGGPRHISQAVNLPSVAICSPSADKAIWLPHASDRYVGIEWRDVAVSTENQNKKIKNGGALYFQLYDTIKPEHVIPLIDMVFEQHVKKVQIARV